MQCNVYKDYHFWKTLKLVLLRASQEPCSKSEAAEQCDDVMKELRRPKNFPEEDWREVSDTKCKSTENISEGEPYLQDSQRKKLTHSFLFISEFVTLDDLGRVIVSSLPEFPLKEVPTESNNVSRTASPQHLKEASVELDTSTKLSEKKNEQVKDASASQVRSHEDGKHFSLKSSNFLKASQQQTLVRQSLQTPISKHGSGENICNSPKDTTTILFDEKDDDDLKEFDLSLRLTNFLECGIVPESPVNISERPCIGEDEFKVPDHVSMHGVHSQLVVKSPKQSERGADFCGHEMNGQSSFTNEIQISATTVNKNVPTFKSTSPTVEEAQSPQISLSDTSCKDWNLNSGEKSECVEQTRKFRRLRKLGDRCRNKPEDLEKQIHGPSRNFTTSCISADHVRIYHGRGKKLKVYDASFFVEEEAEVSSEVEVSADEEDELDNNSYDDSFIDDRLNPTATSTQAKEGAIDMMAVYRRSLLSQSRLARTPNIGADVTSSSEVPRNESTSTSGTESHFVHKSQNGLESTARNAASSRLNNDHEFSDPVPSRRTCFPEEFGSKIEHRKRKFHQTGYLPVHNLEKEFTFQSMASGKDSILKGDTFPENEDIFDDDQFYDSIDLDAVEEQATKLLRYKSECSTQKQVPFSETGLQNPAVLGSPSFDLGI